MLYKKWRGTTDQTDGQTDRKRRPPPPPGKEFIVQSAKNNKDADTIIYFVVCQWPSTNDWCKTRRVQATSRTRRRIEAIFTVVPCALVQKQINGTKERRDSSGKELSASASRKRQQQQTSIECIKRERMRRVKRSGAIRSSRLPLGIRRKSYSTVTTKKRGNTHRIQTKAMSSLSLEKWFLLRLTASERASQAGGQAEDRIYHKLHNDERYYCLSVLPVACSSF